MSQIHLEKFKQRPLSYSSLASWEWSKKEWAEKYIEGKEKFSPELAFGKSFANSIEDGTCKVKKLMNDLQKTKEFEFRCRFGDIELIGFADAFCDITFKILDEIKTGNINNPWDQKRVDNHSQLTMYALQNFIMHKIRPEDTIFTLYWVPTIKTEIENGDFSSFDYSIDYKYPIEVHKFKTTRTTKDIMTFGAYLKKTYAEMLKFVEEYE